jgi:FtsZ-binding cell division protein ZapB
MFNYANDFPFITLNAVFIRIVGQLLEVHVMQNISTETIQQIAIDYLKRKKNTERIDISTVEQKNGVWVIRGTCPIDLEGHPWAEKFEVVLDEKGKIKSIDFSLL